jgi:hypothetical protein
MAVVKEYAWSGLLLLAALLVLIKALPISKSARSTQRQVSSVPDRQDAISIDPTLKALLGETARRCIARYKAEPCIAVLASCGERCMAALPDAQRSRVKADYWAIMKQRELIYPEDGTRYTR